MTSLGLVIIMFLALRFLPIKVFTKNDFVVTDQYFHFFLARAYRESGYRGRETLGRIDLAPPAEFYPPLFHLLCSLLKPAALHRYAYLFTPLLQLLNCLAVMGAVYWLSLPQGAVYALSMTFYAGLVFTVIPFFFGPNSGLTFATPRPLGELLSNVFLLSLFMVSLGHSPYVWTAVAVSSFFLGGMASRFGIQTNVFVGVLFALLTLDLRVLGVLAFSALASLTVGYTYYGQVARYHWRHMVTYLKVYSHHATDIKVLHTPWFSVIRQAFDKFREGNLLEGLKKLYYSAVLRLVLMNPFAFFALLGSLAVYAELPPTIRNCLGLLMAGILTAVLTMTKPLKFLGEGERYLEFGSLFALCLLSAHLVQQEHFTLIFWALIGYCVCFDLMAYKLHSRYDNCLREGMLAFLRSLCTSKIMAFPSYTHPIVLFYTDMRVPYFDGWAYRDEYYRDPEKTRAMFHYLYGTYPGPNLETLDEQLRTYGVDYILLCRAEGAYTYAANEAFFKKRFSEVFHNEGYAVYAVKDRNGKNTTSGGTP